MSIYLYQRLLSSGLFDRRVLLDALSRSTALRVSLAEALIMEDVGHGRALVDLFHHDGEKADDAWRPDPRLMLALPPGICEQFLAFPYRERSGAVELATVTPMARGLREEFEVHFSRPVVLFRGSLQALLAAAGASVDLSALNYRLSEPAPSAPGGTPIPLVRKSSRLSARRERTATSPGIGGDSGSFSGKNSSLPPSWITPGHPHVEQLSQVRELRELTYALGELLPKPWLMFELADGVMRPRRDSVSGSCEGALIPLDEESGLTIAVEEGSYLGIWYGCSVHERFYDVFSEGALVRVERIGSSESALVVAMPCGFDAHDGHDILSRAQDAWQRISDRAKIYKSRSAPTASQ